jgi:hypothetical protein
MKKRLMDFTSRLTILAVLIMTVGFTPPAQAAQHSANRVEFVLYSPGEEFDTDNSGALFFNPDTIDAWGESFTTETLTITFPPGFDVSGVTPADLRGGITDDQTTTENPFPDGSGQDGFQEAMNCSGYNDEGTGDQLDPLYLVSTSTSTLTFSNCGQVTEGGTSAPNQHYIYIGGGINLPSADQYTVTFDGTYISGSASFNVLQTGGGSPPADYSLDDTNESVEFGDSTQNGTTSMTFFFDPDDSEGGTPWAVGETMVLSFPTGFDVSGVDHTEIRAGYTSLGSPDTTDNPFGDEENAIDGVHGTACSGEEGVINNGWDALALVGSSASGLILEACSSPLSGGAPSEPASVYYIHVTTDVDLPAAGSYTLNVGGTWADGSASMTVTSGTPTPPHALVDDFFEFDNSVENGTTGGTLYFAVNPDGEASEELTAGDTITLTFPAGFDVSSANVDEMRAGQTGYGFPQVFDNTDYPFDGELTSDGVDGTTCSGGGDPNNGEDGFALTSVTATSLTFEACRTVWGSAPGNEGDDVVYFYLGDDIDLPAAGNYSLTVGGSYVGGTTDMTVTAFGTISAPNEFDEGATFTLDDTEAGSTTGGELNFTLSTGSEWGAGDKITLTFPSGFDVSSVTASDMRAGYTSEGTDYPFGEEGNQGVDPDDGCNEGGGNGYLQLSTVTTTSLELTACRQLFESPFGVIYFDIEDNLTLPSEGGSYNLNADGDYAGGNVSFNVTGGAQEGGSTVIQAADSAATLSRLKKGTAASFDLQFTLPNAQSTDLVVTFPAEFTVTGPFESGTCSGGGSITIPEPGYTATTLTAEKSSCDGVVTLVGAAVVTPSETGIYEVTFVNDSPGAVQIPVVDDDQISVTGNIDPTMTFDLDVGLNYGETSAAYTVDFGTLSPGVPKVSDNSGIPSIWIDLATNASGGATVTVSSANQGMQSTSNPSDVVETVTGAQALGLGVEAYGICVDPTLGGTTRSGGQTGWGIATGNYDSTPCSGSASDVLGELEDDTSSPNLLTTDNPLTGGWAQVRVGIEVTNATPAHPDYTDTLTFLATGTY